jgi:2-oxoglutarate ferredoxin oxidoreductase subunit gamma
MLERLTIAGAGGQGIVLAGKLLATAAMDELPFVTFFPDYGAEVRGGNSKCQVILSTDEIASPVTDQLDSLLVMNQGAAGQFRGRMAATPLVILNSSLASAERVPPSAVLLPLTEWAAGLGDVRAANFVMLGAYLARRPVVSPARMEGAIVAALADKGERVADLNRRAFRMGLER